ncbi:hypothetical protein FOYG_17585 [Fusarium oxysporum NRRL 32931]|uniref:Uncharacterized protein n=1 Tax=Fusarium oxysporum NRRL 32931 TaxID=660029 RepID=W9HGB5_FUSOX|nr:hypothetical protein FOYG_17585 [Fusarium oxysporum NRRL 32931]
MATVRPASHRLLPCPIRRPTSRLEVILQFLTNPSIVSIRCLARLRRRTIELLRHATAVGI